MFFFFWLLTQKKGLKGSGGGRKLSKYTPDYYCQRLVVLIVNFREIGSREKMLREVHHILRDLTFIHIHDSHIYRIYAVSSNVLFL